MRWTTIWILTSLVFAVGYVAYAAAYHDLFRSPGEFGDTLSGLTAFVSLPGIFLFLVQHHKEEWQQRRREARDNRTRKLSAIMDVYGHLNHEFFDYGMDLKYQIEDVLKLEPKKPLQQWENPKNIFGYLKANHFSTDRLDNTLRKIESRAATVYLCRRLCAHVDTLMASVESFNNALTHPKQRQAFVDSIQKHPVYEISAHLRPLCDRQEQV